MINCNKAFVHFYFYRGNNQSHYWITIKLINQIYFKISKKK